MEPDVVFKDAESKVVLKGAQAEVSGDLSVLGDQTEVRQLRVNKQLKVISTAEVVQELAVFGGIKTYRVLKTQPATSISPDDGRVDVWEGDVVLWRGDMQLCCGSLMIKQGGLYVQGDLHIGGDLVLGEGADVLLMHDGERVSLRALLNLKAEET